MPALVPVVPKLPLLENVNAPPTSTFVAYALVNGVAKLPIAVVPAVDRMFPAVNVAIWPSAKVFELEPKSYVFVVVGIESPPPWNTSPPEIFAPSEP